MQGLVDLDAELARCQKKLDLARLNLEKLKKVESQPGYEDTIPTNVRHVNEEKVLCRFIWNLMPELIH
jgi:valyl-tRNA synthetase